MKQSEVVCILLGGSAVSVALFSNAGSPGGAVFSVIMFLGLLLVWAMGEE